MPVEDVGMPSQAQLQETDVSQLGSSDPYFDYTSFARPWNYHLDHATDTSDWFSSQFFAALRETDLAYSPPFQTWSSADYGHTNLDFSYVLDDSNATPSYIATFNEGTSSLLSSDAVARSQQTETQLNEHIEHQPGLGSRVASPPNESSNEDRLPFAWDPRSKPIAKAKPIVLPVDDPIFADVNQTVKISEATIARIRTFLHPPGLLNGEDTFTLPEPSLVNVFISLFFTKFLLQAPVVHRSTVDMEALPPPLLAIMIVIGSCYSRLRHTRRFGIIVFDRTRQNLLALIEEDNSLMREPSIIYAASLVCYMGLWCGNKRAFELSEALRAVVVTYIRRLPNIRRQQDQEPYRGRQASTYGPASSAAHEKCPDELQLQWSDWIKQESQKRLRWFVYMIDSQFPAVLGMSGMLTMADIRKWECPCDEDFWNMPTARSWKNRLGSASEPSCPIFGSLTALLLSAQGQSAPGHTEHLLPNVNAWSANLLIAVAASEVFHYQETLVILRTYEEPAQLQPQTLLESSPTRDRVADLVAMLKLWNDSYGHQDQSRRPITTSCHLQRCSIITYYLARLYLVFPVSEIQDCLGRSGPADTRAAMGRLAAWAVQSPEQTTYAVEDACMCISLIMRSQGESGPYDIIGLFLCHVIVWSFAHAISSQQKQLVLERLQNNPSILPGVLEVIKAGYSHGEISDGSALDAAQLILRHAIQSLAQLGTWGASSNLALLLHLHPGVTG